jgi:hypothetical protein
VAAERGLSLSGPDLGSPSVPVLAPVRPALLTGQGMRATHAGYIWHWFDTRIEQPLSRLDWANLFMADLSAYTHLILPDGNYEFMPLWAVERIIGFVRAGGTLIAARGAAPWVETLALEWAFATNDNGDQDNGGSAAQAEARPYGDFIGDFARELIGGSALHVSLDITHPLAFGYEQPALTVFRRGRHVLQAINNPYVHAARYADQPLAAGYLSQDNRERLAGTPALVATRHGEGQVIRMADDYLFRGYWLGSERLFANALFFSQLIRATELPNTD